MTGSGRRQAALVALLGCAGLLAAAPGIAQQNHQPTGPTTAPLACVVAPAVELELGRLPATASLEDYEGAILFAVSQSECSTGALIDGLTMMLAQPGISAMKRKAILNVIEELRRRRRGTGSINGAGFGYGYTGFSSPLIGIGGGSSNYTAP